jgi:crotonobetaine/carnitine-CoA ligase
VSFRTVPELLHLAVERYGEAPAIVTAEGTESFRELGRTVGGIAGVLRNKGLEPGDRVLIVAPNSVPMVHVWLGTICAGAIPAAVNPESTQSELEYFSGDLQPRLTLRDPEVQELGSSKSPSPAGGGGSGWGLHDPLAPAAIVYTSGTTSRPKGVLVRHAAYTESGDSFPTWIGLGAGERLWVCLPLFHINAQAYSLMSALAHGFSLALTPKFHASSFWHDARALQVTSVNVVGAMLDFVARQPEASWVKSSLRTIYSAPGPPPEERRELERRFQVRIVTGYGMSENPFGCAETVTSRDKLGSIGRPRQPASRSFENRLRIVRQDGSEAATAEAGELCFQNPVLTPGYWNAPAITASALAGGWLHTGDAGYCDQEGDVFLSGRYKEMIRRRGENIAPAEVEEVLRAHDAVEVAAVFGVDAGLEEEEVVAAVVVRAGAQVDQSSLQAFLRSRLAAFKVPSRIMFRDSLPMTATHRVAKDVLQREYGRGR